MPDALRLEESPKIETGGAVRVASPVARVILPLAASRNEVRIHFAIFGGDFQSPAWRDPKPGPRLNRFPFPPDGVSDQVSVIGVPVAITVVPVVQMARIAASLPRAIR